MGKIDEIDGRILRALSEDGRISNVQLAEKVGLSASACLRRVQELERSGVISGYRAVLDRAALGRGFVAYVAVGLSDHSKASQQSFERSMSTAPQVLECHNITGTVEYLLRVLGTHPQVNALTTYVVMGSPKDERA